MEEVDGEGSQAGGEEKGKSQFVQISNLGVEPVNCCEVLTCGGCGFSI